jgi:predicted nucleotide-binding protein
VTISQYRKVASRPCYVPEFNIDIVRIRGRYGHQQQKSGVMMARQAKQTAPMAEPALETKDSPKRAKVMQTDVPAYPLDEALQVARTILDNYAFKPTRPLDVAAAMGLAPTGTGFRMLTGASMAYGFTDGGWNAATITPQPLARRILQPTQVGDDVEARREAILKPKVLREFLRKYDGSRLPREDIALNVLSQMGVPANATKRTLDLIMASAEAVGFLQKIKDGTYVNLRSAIPMADESGDDEDAWDADQDVVPPAPLQTDIAPPVRMIKGGSRLVNNRVFVTHGKNREFIDPIKQLLAFGELEPVVSVDKPSVSQPVPDKVMNDMRSCSAAIIHVDAEQRLIDQDTNEHIVLNPNVLIEIGAAMALFGRRFILLVRDGVRLPSNLQGLFEVRYKGDKLDGEATIELLKAITDIKNHPLPDFGASPS